MRRLIHSITAPLLLIAVLVPFFVIAARFATPSRERLDMALNGHVLSPAEIGAMVSQRQAHIETTIEFKREMGQRVVRGEAGKVIKTPSAFGSDPMLSDIEKLIWLRELVLWTPFDEATAFSALSRMNPAKFDFNPHVFNYGGALIYPVGALLFVLDRAGLLKASGGLGAMIEDPDQVGRMYLAAKLLIAGSFLATLLLIWDIGRLLASPRAGLIAALAYGLSDSFGQALVIKPHVPAAMWTAVAISLLLRFDRDARIWRIWAAGAAVGMAAGSIVTAAPVALLVPLLLWRKSNWPTWLGQCAIAGLAAAAVFFATNPYIVLDAYQFATDAAIHGTGRSRLTPQLGRLWESLLDTPFHNPPFSMLACAAVVYGSWRSQGAVAGLSRFALVLIPLLGSTVGSGRTVTFMYPIFYILAGLAIDHWLQASPESRWRPGLVVVTLLVTAANPATEFVNIRKWDQTNRDFREAFDRLPIDANTVMAVYARSIFLPTPLYPARIMYLDLNDPIDQPRIDYVLVPSGLGLYRQLREFVGRDFVPVTPCRPDPEPGPRALVTWVLDRVTRAETVPPSRTCLYAKTPAR
ncbi:MAG: DUF2723 domain-containing protein [Alphaproteobacteria bacterium]|nr:DUF2723 domain-containing protein [Alphaproteobacteria bacterium]